MFCHDRMLVEQGPPVPKGRDIPQVRLIAVTMAKPACLQGKGCQNGTTSNSTNVNPNSLGHHCRYRNLLHERHDVGNGREPMQVERHTDARAIV